MSFKKSKILGLVAVLFMFNGLFGQDWQTDLAKAHKLAKEGQKNIVLVFQGSDWCAPCIKLDREIWSTEEFQHLAKDKFVMLKADFPRRQKNKLPSDQEEQNKELASRYNPKGYFPYVVVMEASGKVLGDAGYEKTTPKEYFQKLSSL